MAVLTPQREDFPRWYQDVLTKAKLADFGLVRRLADLAQGGAPLAGTPTFMAPELFRGTPASPQSDIFGGKA